MAGRSDSKSDEGCGSLADWARNRKRRREDLKKETIKMLNPLNGDLIFSISHVAGDKTSSLDDPIVGLHLFKKQRLESSARSCSLFTCTSKGNASFRIVEAPKSPADSLLATSFKSWSVCGSVCVVLVSKSAFGSLRTLASFGQQNLKDDHRKIVTGTSNHKVVLYPKQLLKILMGIRYILEMALVTLHLLAYGQCFNERSSLATKMLQSNILLNVTEILASLMARLRTNMKILMKFEGSGWIASCLFCRWCLKTT
ncbi:hypothetical protein V2J09_006354 [Rumex salicifolius]